MNPNLNLLHPYPFEKLHQLYAPIQANSKLSAVSFSLGEPKHPTPEIIKSALVNGLDGLSHYPSTKGSQDLREAIASWIMRRYHLKTIDCNTQIIPVSGTREALFAIAQTIIDNRQNNAYVICPNPFYQIYEGAAYLAGAKIHYVNCDQNNFFQCDYESVVPEIWQKTQLLYVCSPGNPTGKVLSLKAWQNLFELSDKYNFVIIADECYSEIYFDENNPPLGALSAANQLNRGFERLLVFSSLSKRSSVPGLRSGFVAGDAHLISRFLLYRTYHGSALSLTTQAASIAAWNDETHVKENRLHYTKKFQDVIPILSTVLDVNWPDAAFYLWTNVANTGLNDVAFAQRLYEEKNVSVLPGSYLAREAHGNNPGKNYIRMALVANYNECLDGARRLQAFCKEIN